MDAPGSGDNGIPRTPEPKKPSISQGKSPNKLIGTPIAHASKRKWQATGWTIAARAQPIKWFKESPYRRNLITMDEEASTRKGSVGREVSARHICSGKVNASGDLQTRAKLSAKEFEVDYIQVGDSGPSAYIPDKINIVSVEPLLETNSQYITEARPIVILLPKAESKDASKQIKELEAYLAQNKQMAIAHLRTIQESAMAEHSISTFRVDQEEMIALMPASDSVIADCKFKVQAPEFLVGMFVQKTRK